MNRFLTNHTAEIMQIAAGYNPQPPALGCAGPVTWRDGWGNLYMAETVHQAHSEMGRLARTTDTLLRPIERDVRCTCNGGHSMCRQ